jgi:hypothetical protein
VNIVCVQWICYVCSVFVSVGKILRLSCKKKGVNFRALGKRL